MNWQTRSSMIIATFTLTLSVGLPSNLVAFGDDEVVITPLSTAAHRQQFPAISGDLVVWEDNRNDPNPPTPGTYDIYLYDLLTNTERQLASRLGNLLLPDIDGERVVWSSGCEVYLDDLQANAIRQLTTNPRCQSYPKIAGDSVIYIDDRNGYISPTFKYDLFVFDLTTNTERQITQGTVIPDHPDIDGDRIVWSDYRGGNRDIYLYDLKTGEERRITTDPAWQALPAISGDKVVWVDLRSGNFEIYLYDLVTNTERRITARPNKKWRPAIWGNRIVWYEDSMDGDPAVYNGENYDIYTYDLATSTEQRITSNPWAETGPKVWKNRLVWNDYRNGSSEIDLYFAELPNRPPVLNPVADRTVSEGQLLTFTLSATDPDGDTLISDLTTVCTADSTAAVLQCQNGYTLPNASLDASTGVFSWQPGPTQADIYALTFTVRDGPLGDSRTLSDSTTMTITVQEAILVLGGRIATPSGSPVADITVELRNNMGKRKPTTSKTDVQGRYQFIGLQPGTYTVKPSSTGQWRFTPTSQEVTLGTQDQLAVNFTAMAR